METYSCCKHFFLIYVALMGLSCANTEIIENSKIKAIYHDRSLLLRILEQRSLGKRGESFSLIINKDDQEYAYGFIRNDNQRFNGDTSTSFILQDFKTFDWINYDSLHINKNDTVALKNYMVKQIKEVYHLVSNYGIIGFNSQFKKNGIDLKLILDNGSIILYSKFPDKIENNEWKEYLKKAKRIDRNWYYLTNEI